MTPEVTSAAALSIKFLVLVGVALYTGFAIIIVRQEQLMAGVLEESFEPILRICALIHLTLAIGLFFLALLIL